MPVLFDIINMAFFTLPFHCEYVGACYGRFITPQPLSNAIEKNDEVRGSCRLMLSNKGVMHN